MIADSSQEKPEKPAPAKPIFTVLVGHRSSLGDALEFFLKHYLGSQYDPSFFRFGDDLGFDLRHADELLSLAHKQPFDLIVLYAHMRSLEEKALFTRLKAQYRKPIIVINGGEPDRPDLLEAGIDAFIPAPFDLESFRRALGICLKKLETA